MCLITGITGQSSIKLGKIVSAHCGNITKGE